MEKVFLKSELSIVVLITSIVILQLEMTELNLKQLRSANNCNDDNNAGYYQGEEESIVIKSENANQNSEQEDLISLRKLNETQRMRIEELTLYIQQAAEGLLLRLLL